MNLVWDVDPVAFYLFGFPVKYYSILLALGFNISVTMSWIYLFKKNIDEESVLVFTIILLISVVLGLRLFEALFYSPQLLRGNILEIFLPIKITDEGISLKPFRGLSGHGAICAVIICTFIFCKKKKIDFFEVCDYIVPYVCISGALVRIGNFFNSEIVGIETSSRLGIIFKQISEIPRYPVQLFEAMAYVSIALLYLFVIKKFIQKNTALFKNGFGLSLVIILVYISRILIEMIKEPLSGEDATLFEKTGLKYGQILSIGFILFFGCVLIYTSPLWIYIKNFNFF